ncbi:hypothetical protein [Ensifer sp. LCM 4579]|uniref:hypothetical protein n=1 Tax=Ensifer sp. LCM 4579 TaxID=1848292 RepID=UPI0008D9E38D|nr:hypothetical protein [Ensifer sp. LCM 4579]OHV80029.1 hypothetical protein LCM4579_22830 [Ensifer sp. LCM 4579]
MNVHTAEQKTKFREILSTQRLDSTGKIGALLFVFSPVLEAACYWWLINELDDVSWNRILLGPGLV